MPEKIFYCTTCTVGPINLKMQSKHSCASSNNSSKGLSGRMTHHGAKNKCQIYNINHKCQFARIWITLSGGGGPGDAFVLLLANPEAFVSNVINS